MPLDYPRTLKDRRALFASLYDVLERDLGPMNWWPADTPFEMCIGAILTQNAPWTGVTRSIRNMKSAGLFGVDEIIAVDESVLADVIRPSIYHHQKARRLKSFCRFLAEECDRRIENMASFDISKSRDMLLALPGIGPETADSILLYALGKPVFVVDAYTARIFGRHGITDESYGYEELRMFFEDALEPDPAFFNEFHALLCRTGSEFCRKKPRCESCPASHILGEPVL